MNAIIGIDEQRNGTVVAAGVSRAVEFPWTVYTPRGFVKEYTYNNSITLYV